MKSIRLLPVVIFAALALLLFKGIGLISNGSYVLTGVEFAAASGGEEAAHGTTAEATAATDTAAMPGEVTLADTSPTMDDTAPTIATKPEGGEGAHGEEAAHEAPAAETSAEPVVTEGEHGTPTEGETEHVADVPDIACPGVEEQPSEAPHEPATDSGALTDRIGNAMVTGCPSVEPPVDEHGDAVPTTKDGDGVIVPLATVSGDNAEAAVLERLSERRAELDKYAADLEMRAALVEAAEKRIDERTAQLQQLEAQINALVDQKQGEDDAQFKAVVSMYETMKARDAAEIFDTLDLRVLLRVARAINPRKMAPILAGMDAQRAQELTAAMASERPPPMVADVGEDLANLPQIVGK